MRANDGNYHRPLRLDLMLETSQIGLLTAFVAGIISFLSPCVLPLVPGYLSYVGGQTVAGDASEAPQNLRLPILSSSLSFVLGFSTVFVLLGASATALGQLLLEYRYELNIVGGAVILLFGALMIGLLRPSWLMRDVRIHLSVPGGRPVSAYLLGLAFAFGWTPCIGPILGAILTLSATSATVSDGVLLLAIYSAGLGLPFVLAALFTKELTARLKSIGRIGRVLQVAAGAVLILMGGLMITGHLSVISYWILETFPALAEIG